MFILAGGVMAIILACFLVVALFVCWLYGIILCLRASILLFILCFFVHVPFIIFGLVKALFDVDLPKMFVDALR